MALPQEQLLPEALGLVILTAILLIQAERHLNKRNLMPCWVPNGISERKKTPRGRSRAGPSRDYLRTPRLKYHYSIHPGRSCNLQQPTYVN